MHDDVWQCHRSVRLAHGECARAQSLEQRLQLMPGVELPSPAADGSSRSVSVETARQGRARLLSPSSLSVVPVAASLDSAARWAKDECLMCHACYYSESQVGNGVQFLEILRWIVRICFDFLGKKICCCPKYVVARECRGRLAASLCIRFVCAKI